MNIKIEKHLVTIYGNEFPIHDDVMFVTNVIEGNYFYTWFVSSKGKWFPISKICKNGKASPNVFSQYLKAIKASEKNPFDNLGSLRKYDGIKIIPGYGVFELPCGINVRLVGNKPYFIVFASNKYRKTFSGSDAVETMAMAYGYYLKVRDEVQAIVNTDVSSPLIRRRPEKYVGNTDVLVPTGVFCNIDGKDQRVYVYAGGRRQYLGSTRTKTGLYKLIDKAIVVRKDLLEKAKAERHVVPKFTPFSKYKG